jgi:hypothetical protein
MALAPEPPSHERGPSGPEVRGEARGSLSSRCQRMIYSAQECLNNAQECVRIASEAKGRVLTTVFLECARHWLELARQEEQRATACP